MAASKAAGALIAILLFLPATAAAQDPVATGSWTYVPGTNDRINMDVVLNQGGPITFARFDLPVDVESATPTRAPAGTSCGKDPALPRRVRCAYGSGGVQ